MALVQAEVDLANMALGGIGAKQMTLADQSSVQGVQANLHYAPTRDSLLRSCDWNFAVKRLALVDTWVTNKSYTVGQYVWTNMYGTTLAQTILGVADYSGTVAGTINVQTSAAHLLSTGMYITIAGTTDYNGSYYITVVDTTHFYVTKTYTSSQTGTLAYSNVNLLFKCATANTSGTFRTDLTASRWTIAIARPSFGYSYQYDLPSDCLRFRSADIDIYGIEAYTIEGKLLLSDEQVINIEYIYQVTTTTIFDSLFYDLFVLKLALKLLPALAGTQTPSLVNQLFTETQYLEHKARTVTKQETNTSGRSDWNEARVTWII
jgi:hypothetical protein